MSAASQRRAVAVLLGLVSLLPVCPVRADTGRPAAPPPSGAIQVTGLDASARYAQRLLEMINRTRWEHGHLPPLKSNAALAHAALAHSQDMAHNDFFGHQGGDGLSPWERIDAAGYGNWYILAENIAAGQKTPAEVLQAWMDSPHHRENLLNPDINEAGIGYVFQADDTYPGGTWGYGHYWTLDMGTRWDAFPLVLAREAYSTTTRQTEVYIYGQGWATQVRLSNDGLNWSPWQTYQPTVTWSLPAGDGLKRVYGQVRDSQGLTITSMDEIWLQERTAPPGAPGDFQVSPQQAVFIIRQGQSRGQPLRHRLRITDNAGTTYAWHASWNQPWLRLVAGSGLPPAEPTLTLTERAGTLPAGSYTATLSIWNELARVEIPVRLYVLPRLYSVCLPVVLRVPLP